MFVLHRCKRITSNTGARRWGLPVSTENQSQATMTLAGTMILTLSKGLALELTSGMVATEPMSLLMREFALIITMALSSDFCGSVNGGYLICHNGGSAMSRHFEN